MHAKYIANVLQKLLARTTASTFSNKCNDYAMLNHLICRKVISHKNKPDLALLKLLQWLALILPGSSSLY